MSAQDDGGNAFPLPLGNGNHAEPQQSGGISLRDYFAGKALESGFLSNLQSTTGYIEPEKMARLFYEIADAMMEARK